jgi:ribosome-binding factor A
MENLLNKLSARLQEKLKDYKVATVYIEFNEVNVTSGYCMDTSWYEAIERELGVLGYEFE